MKEPLWGDSGFDPYEMPSKNESRLEIAAAIIGIKLAAIVFVLMWWISP